MISYQSKILYPHPQVPDFFVYNSSHYMSGIMGLALFFRRMTHCRLWTDLEFEINLQVTE